jgi:hypothetical protein
MSLTGKTLAASYKDILQVDNSNSGVTTSLKQIKDGEGTASALNISDDNVRIVPNNDDSTFTLQVRTNSGAVVLAVDTTNELVKASGNNVNTQYAHFGQTNSAGAFVDDTHHAIPFGSNWSSSDILNPAAFGTSTDPATSFTTAEGNATRASDLVPVLWRLPDPISIDSITSIEGADTATGDTTRMHLFSYDFTSGSTSALTNGTLLGHNSDVTNAGSEQAYLSSWTVDSAAVAAGKVILAFFKSDSINSDYSISITVKYHLT